MSNNIVEANENKKKFNLKKIVKRFINRKIVFPLIYEIAGFRKPLKQNKVVFLEIRFEGITDSYQEIYDTLKREYNADVHVHHFRQGFISRVDEYKRKIAFFKDAATAKYVVFNDSSDTQGTMKKREGQHFLNTWHATGAFKKFGFGTADKEFGGTRREQEKYPLHPKYDMVTVSSPEICWAYVQAMGMEKNKECVQAIGTSRTDVFFNEAFISDAYRHVYEQVPQAKGKKIILYAPTFRGTARNAMAPDKLDIEEMYENLSDEYILIIKHHPMIKKEVRPVIEEKYSNFAFDLTDDGVIADLLIASDICITDYSSIIFEYSLMEKPLIFLAYDLDSYYDNRGFFYDYNEMTPGPVYTETSEIVDYIKHIDERFDKAQIHDFKNKFMSSCDGHATERIMNEFFGELDEYKKEELVPKVSVIVPACNTSRFIEECLTSIKKQTLKDFEVFVIDDGSTDSTVDIARKFERRDRRFHVITKEHTNAGDSRNRGIKMAKGKYIVFWDADDFFEENALERMYEFSEENQDDICICRNYRYDNLYELKRTVQNDFGDIPEKKVFNRRDIPENIFNICTNVPWNKMIRLDFIKENGLCFQNIEKAEDAYFSMTAIAMAERVSVLDEYLVNWRCNIQSLTTSSNKSPKCIFEAFEKTKEYLEEKGIYEDVKQSFINKAFDSYIYWIKCFMGEAHLDNFKYSFKYVRDEAFEKLGMSDIPADYIYKPEQYRMYQRIKENDEAGLIMIFYDQKQGVNERSTGRNVEKLRRTRARELNNKRLYNEVLDSFAYRVGMKVTWLPRKINALIHNK
ncbi:MAG: CDP-glycerol glycerophosphotransferase family protein [Butyrivibrio sp.]|nr:CDP-glycerol glycerophosphotransferase family protein [Butyrivibrio sp.]